MNNNEIVLNAIDPIEGNISEILKELGQDKNRQGLINTPKRVAKVYRYLTSGYNMNIPEVVNGAIFDSEGSEMIIARGIEVYSLCEHHLLPFYGVAYIGYLPNKKIIGISKLARLVDMFARRLQIQERLSVEIANALKEVLDPKGVGVVVKCKHLCMMMRGVEKQNSEITTSCMLGMIREDPRTRAEFLDLIKT